jgi:hypothetical protein
VLDGRGDTPSEPLCSQRRDSQLELLESLRAASAMSEVSPPSGEEDTDNKFLIKKSARKEPNLDMPRAPVTSRQQ